jgi:hypothetical protein
VAGRSTRSLEVMAKKRQLSFEEERAFLLDVLFDAAQKEEYWSFEGERYRRIAYGEEIDDWDSDHFPCGDCGVSKGQFHLAACDIEKCPKCLKQALGCSCKRDGLERP